jgi:hypothetical protein
VANILVPPHRSVHDPSAALANLPVSKVHSRPRNVTVDVKHCPGGREDTASVRLNAVLGDIGWRVVLSSSSVTSLRTASSTSSGSVSVARGRVVVSSTGGVEVKEVKEVVVRYLRRRRGSGWCVYDWSRSVRCMIYCWVLVI